MDKPKHKSGGIVGGLLAVPTQFVTGYFVGLFTPIATLAAIAGGIYLLTGKVPFLSHTWPDKEGGQHLSFKLMPPDEAKAVFIREKERIGSELKVMSAEIKTLAEQAKAKTSMSKED